MVNVIFVTKQVCEFESQSHVLSSALSQPQSPSPLTSGYQHTPKKQGTV